MKINTSLLIILIVLSTALLVGRLFDASWAGGNGYEIQPSGVVGDQEYQRGETVSSGDAWMLLEFCDAEIWMDVNTQVKLIDGRSTPCQVNVIQGRIVATGDLSVLTRDLETRVSGRVSFVHYSWLDEIEIATLDGTTSVHFSEQIVDVKQAIRMNILSPYEYEEILFDPHTSSASDFYEQVNDIVD